MQYELKTLEDLVQNKINLVKQKKLISNETLELQLDIAQSEKQRIKIAIADTVTLLKEEKHAKHFILQHQKGIISLLDLLLIMIGQSEDILRRPTNMQGTSIIAVQKTVFLVLEDLLHFIENRYTTYCNLSIKIPDKYKLIQIRDFKVRVDCILGKVPKTISELLEVALDPIVCLIDKPKIKITYTEIIYRKELLKGICNIVENTEEIKLEHELFKLLTYLNFNSLYLINYVIRKIKNELTNLETYTEKANRLALHNKMLNQCQIRPGFSLYPENRTIIHYLTEWVMEESYYLEKKTQLQGLNKEQQNELLGKNLKMGTGLTVPQIACFVRLLVEAGAIKGMIKEDIIRFYSTNYRSKFQENISQGSFHSKYFAIDESVKEDVKDLIINMLNELRKLKPKG